MTQTNRGLLSALPQVDKARAIRLVVFGLVLALVGMAILMVSQSIAGASTPWGNMASQENEMNFWNGLYGNTEYEMRQAEITRTMNLMALQLFIFAPIARVAMSFGLGLLVLGFVFLAMDATVDEKSRHVFAIIAAIVVVLLLLSVFPAGIIVAIGP